MSPVYFRKQISHREYKNNRIFHMRSQESNQKSIIRRPIPLGITNPFTQNPHHTEFHITINENCAQFILYIYQKNN